MEKNPRPRRGGGVRLRKIGGQGGKGDMGGEGSVGRGGEGWGPYRGQGSVVRGAVMALMLMTMVKWNLQRVSLREQNRGRLRRVAEWVEQRGWKVV